MKERRGRRCRCQPRATRASPVPRACIPAVRASCRRTGRSCQHPTASSAPAASAGDTLQVGFCHRDISFLLSHRLSPRDSHRMKQARGLARSSCSVLISRPGERWNILLLERCAAVSRHSTELSRGGSSMLGTWGSPRAPPLPKTPPNPPCRSTALSPARRARGSRTHFVLVEDVENKGGEFGGIAEGEELLVDLLKAGGVELPAGAVLDEALVPAEEGQRDGRRAAPLAERTPGGTEVLGAPGPAPLAACSTRPIGNRSRRVPQSWRSAEWHR